MDGTSSIQGKSVLIVDDNRQMQRLVRQLLKTAGMGDTVFAGNGKEALTQLRRRRFDIVIADWMMPEMDGLAFVSAVRAEKGKSYADVPVIMLTGQGTINDVKTALAAGINGYVVKPCSPKALLTQVEKVLA